MLDAPRDLVFRAWTRAEHLSRWHCPRDVELTHFEADVRPGGAYRMGMRAPDGLEHWISGRYRELVAPERLVFTWVYEGEQPRNETIVTVTLADEPGGRTRLTLRQTHFRSEEGRDEVQGGWTTVLDRLAAHLAEARA